MSVFTEMH
jgi:threonine dehydratase